MKKDILARGIARLKRSWGKYSFDRVANKILDTAPLSTNGDSPIFLSQVCHRDVTAYLIAIKSLYMGIGHGQVIIINDGSLTRNDISIICHHIPKINLLDIRDINTGNCPKGGTWERLTKIIELSADHYVIQADSDTIVTLAIPEVVQCWRENKSFILGTDVGQQVAPAPETARLAQEWIEKYKSIRVTVGTVAEASLDTLPNAAEHYYVHGSSGFAGFAKGCFQLRNLERFSDWMRARLGARWDEWGSEQIGSNYILANAPNTVVLPLNRYACFEPKLPRGNRAFLHFIGSHRYAKGFYRRNVSAFINEYSANPKR